MYILFFSQKLSSKVCGWGHVFCRFFFCFDLPSFETDKFEFEQGHNFQLLKLNLRVIISSVNFRTVTKTKYIWSGCVYVVQEEGKIFYLSVSVRVFKPYCRFVSLLKSKLRYYDGTIVSQAYFNYNLIEWKVFMMLKVQFRWCNKKNYLTCVYRYLSVPYLHLDYKCIEAGFVF
jgi:hypothetical protein